MTIDKNQEVINFLVDCPAIRNNPLYFNFVNAKDNNKQFITVANDRNIQQPYIDGSVLKQYTFTIIDFKSVTFDPIVKTVGYVNENVEDMLDVQSIIDWITAQNEAKNYPDFGEYCFIDDMRATTENPALNSVDVSLTPALARYSITIRIEYLDKTKVLWK